MPDRNINGTEHAWVEERLSAYIDNQLTPLEQAHLERHLRGCSRCQASLASLRWTVSLVKQAPAPALPRQFTLPVPVPARRAPAYGFGFARLATVLATLLLFAVVGVDLISRLGGGSVASAPPPAALSEVAKPTSIALGPTEPARPAQQAVSTSAPSVAPKLQAAPTTAPAPTLGVPPAPAAAPTTAPASTPAAPPAPAAAPPLTPTEMPGRGGGGPETSTADNTTKGAAATPTPLRSPAPARAPAGSATAATPAFAAGAASAPTATPVPPTATATRVSPSATASPPSPTPAAQALVQPTVAPPQPRQAETPAPVVEPVRVAEIGLFFLVIFFGALTILLRRRK